MILKNLMAMSLILGLSACATPDQQVQDTLLTAATFAGKMSRPSATEPVNLEWDSAYEGGAPINYRKNDDLRISGSATLSQAALKAVHRKITLKGSHLLVVDLRQESHGLVNGTPVVWASDKNWGNAQLINEEVLRREKRQLGDLRIGDHLARTKIVSLETEESMVRTQGHSYLRLTVGDYLRPSDVEVDRLIKTMRITPEPVWIHFHCRSGKGRTTVFMTLFDMLVNARHLGFDEIVKRNEEASQDQLLEVFDSKHWRYTYQNERTQFLRAFYNYAKAHPRGEDKLWSEWGY